MTNLNFKEQVDAKASVIAQMIVYIYKENLLENENRIIHNIVLKDTIDFMKQGHKRIIYKDLSSKMTDKMKYYYFDKIYRKKISEKVGHSFDMKKKVLEIYKKKETITPSIQELIHKLSESEKKGEIIPAFDLWTKILWFLPFNALLLLFQHYEKLFDHAQNNKKNFYKKATNYRDSVAIIAEAYAENSVYDVKNITLFNDLVYLCENLIPIFSKDIKHDDVSINKKEEEEYEEYVFVKKSRVVTENDDW